MVGNDDFKELSNDFEPEIPKNFRLRRAVQRLKPYYRTNSPTLCILEVKLEKRKFITS